MKSKWLRRITYCSIPLTLLIGYSVKHPLTKSYAKDFTVKHFHQYYFDNKHGYWERINRKEAKQFEANYQKEQKEKKKLKFKVHHLNTSAMIKRGLRQSSRLTKISRMSNSIADQARDEDLHDVNIERMSRGIAPVEVNYENQKIADTRIGQVHWYYDEYKDHHKIYPKQSVHIDHWAHNEGYADLDAQELHYTNYLHLYRAENCAQTGLGKSVYHNPGYPQYHYDNHNGKDMADNLNHNDLYYDQSEGNSHRDNLLNPKYHYIGSAVYYNPQTRRGDFVENYSN